LTNKK